MSARLEQAAIDREVRLSRAREIVHQHRATRRERMWAVEERELWLWRRRQLAILIARVPHDQLAGLGLSDARVREACLGCSLQAAGNWVHGLALATRPRGVPPSR